MKAKGYFFLMVFMAFLATPVLISLLESQDETIMLSIIEEENTQDTSMEYEKNFEVCFNSYSFSGFQISVPNNSDFEFQQSFFDRYPEPYCPPPQLI